MKRDDEIEAIAHLSNPSPEQVAAALSPTLRKAVAEVARGTYGGCWCGARRRTMERLRAIGSYSRCPSIVAAASSGEVCLTPFGVRVHAAIQEFSETTP